MAAEDPQDESRRIVAVIKNNLAAYPSPLAYQIVGVELDDGITSSRIEWLGEAPEVDPRELLASRDPEERSVREEAVDLLREWKVRTEAQPAAELLKAAQAGGISERTLQRARRGLRIPAWPDGFGGAWYWGPKPQDSPLQSRQPHPGETGETGDDLGKQPPGRSSLATGNGVGEEEAVARIEAAFPGTVEQGR